MSFLAYSTTDTREQSLREKQGRASIAIYVALGKLPLLGLTKLVQRIKSELKA